MRVVAGSARGRRLRAPVLASLRPTGDRVKEAMFDVLEHLDAVKDATVFDLYAGSGALGIEALSRGAKTVTFVESNGEALAVLRENLASVGFDTLEAARVVRSDVERFVKTAEPVDLILCDPPYAFEGWLELSAQLRGGILVAESNREIELSDTFVPYRTYRYGTTLVTVARGKAAGSAS